MELQFYGANCIRLTTKKASIVIDDNLVDLGLKSVTKPGDIAMISLSNWARLIFLLSRLVVMAIRLIQLVR
jgi:hypothetical protein